MQLAYFIKDNPPAKDSEQWLKRVACYYLPHREDPIKDLDLARGGIVKVYEDKPGKTYPICLGSQKQLSMHWLKISKQKANTD